jgi:hypothetical protein
MFQNMKSLPYIGFISAIISILICSGCATVKTTDLPVEQLHERIVAGEIIKPGDYATIITADGMRYSLQVLTATEYGVTGEHHVAVEDGTRDENTFEATQVVVAETIDIPITDIVGVETKDATIIGYAGGVAGGFALGYLMIALPVALLAVAL